ncbi:hypothetical protein NP493_1749g00012 [Ridgeia piscesae]|uniref:Uncharacterized protein n=1 Tax=Ridgeia piscesae TaxID=27915 RepID=A0AAD9JVN6_RIDPI|nr:hypothetical protein NP493_1749g00012 [Ridgeia piscesae]
MFLRGERNGDSLLQQHCLKAMLPYFFAAGHHNYARYLSWYVRQMEHLPQRAKEDLLAEVDREEKNKHKEDGKGRRRLDEADWKKIAVELEKYSHPLNDQQPGVYNICKGQVASDTFELSPVPPGLIDEYGCLRKGDKAVLVKSLSVSVTTPCAPNVVLVDAGQLLYHVVWPVSGTTGDLAASFGTRLAHYPPVSKKIILFDRYDQDAPNA